MFTGMFCALIKQTHIFRFLEKNGKSFPETRVEIIFTCIIPFVSENGK